MEKNKNYFALWLIVIWIIISYQVATKYYHFVVLGSSFGFIDSAWYEVPYQETSSVIVWLSAILICILLWIWIWFTKKQKLGLILWTSWILVWILSHLIWWGINPMYRFDEHPESYWYMDSKEEYIEDTDKYIKLFNKYWSKFWNNFRPPHSLEEHIKIIDSAIVWNYVRVWSQAIDSAGEIYWYDKLFEKLKDKTAETYYIERVFYYSRENHYNWLYDSYEWFYYLKDNWTTESIRKASQMLYEWYEANKWKPEIDFFELDDDYIDLADDKYSRTISNEKWLNHRMLSWYSYKKDKFFLDENWDWYMEKDYYMKNEHDKVNWY